MIERPNPDALLARVTLEELESKRGRLKIFFGAAAGVGKTYEMLMSAHYNRNKGVDVVVGLVETHDRKETVAVLQGLEVLPPKLVQYHGMVQREFDLDGALKRRPALILVDELAHSNASGCRHPKRWQDIEELLNAGINVYTTLNVQHLESLNDDINQVTGVHVSETVPDKVFELADEIELIDLPPDDLLTRLKEGKVYIPQQAERAMQHFFRKGNLIALRELSLRLTADRVDAQMLDYRDNNAIRDIWQIGECVLICIGANQLAERLVRAGKRLATSLHAQCIVIYVETPKLQRLPPEQRDEVLRVLRFAETLGVETAALSGLVISDEILNFAKQRNVTKIVLGKPSRRGFKRWLLGSMVDVLIAEAHDINIYLLGSPLRLKNDGVSSPKNDLKNKGLRFNYPRGQSARKRWSGLAWAIGITTCSSLISWTMSGRFELANIVMVYLLGVVFVAARFGREASIIASFLSVIAFDFFFVAPFFTLSVADAQYLVTFVIMLVVSIIISHLTSNMRAQTKVAAHRERRARVLYALSEELAVSKTLTETAKIAVRHIQAEFGGSNVLLFPVEGGRIIYPSDSPLPESLKGCDISVAQWVFDHKQIAGQGTDTLPGADAVYFPITGFRGVIGVLALRAANLRRVFLPEQRRLLDTFINQIVQTIERVRLSEDAQQSQMRIESESLRNSLLSAISHDLRTPLASIVGAASTLVDKDAQLSQADRQELGSTIFDEALRMSNLTNNILDMARLDSGNAQLNRQWYPLDEIIGGALARLKRKLEGRNIKTKLPEGLCLVRLDAVLIEQVLINIIENACKYSPSGSQIEISAERSAHMLKVSVSDHGPGIPVGEEEKLFDKFYRLTREDSQSGVGLGLSICKAIVIAHGGLIGVNNRPEGGAEFYFVLPMDEALPELEAEVHQDG